MKFNPVMLAVALAVAAFTALPAAAQTLMGHVRNGVNTPNSLATPNPVGLLPAGTPLVASSGNVANASAAASLAAAAGLTNYVTGFQCTAAGATAAAVVNATLTGLNGGTLTYNFVFPAGATVPANSLVVHFSTPQPATAANTAITVTLPAGGAGNTNAACSIQGFRL